MTAADVNSKTVTSKKRMNVFIISYLTYATYYLTRLNFSVALPALALDLGYTKFFLGLMGGAFSIVYALGQLINGQLAERYGAKKLITSGLILSASVNILFGYTELSVMMIILWAMNGYAQSTGWPSVIKLMSEWSNRGSRGKVGGLFGTCFLVGSMAALLLSSYIQVQFGWRATFTLPSVVLIVWIVAFNVSIKEKEETAIREKRYTTYRARQAIISRNILTIVVAYILLQFIRSGFSLWAPTYIFELYRVPIEYAGYFSAIIPLGGIIGSILSGWISDRLNKSRRVPIMAVMSISLCLILLTLHRLTGLGLMMSVVLLFLIGLTLYGPLVIMTTTIPIDSQTYGAASLAGLIDGIGYLGLIFADPFIGWIVDCEGWNGAIMFWTLSSFCATLLILTLWRSEHIEGLTS